MQAQYDRKTHYKDVKCHQTLKKTQRKFQKKFKIQKPIVLNLSPSLPNSQQPIIEIKINSSLSPSALQLLVFK